MTIKSDGWIRRMAAEHGMIEPFADRQVRDGVISYGVSSYGYDMRVADEFRIFHNALFPVVDPKDFDDRSFIEYQGEIAIIPPNSFALARSIEYFRIPRDVLTLCVGKSTYARCFSGDTRVALVDGSAPTLEEMTLRAETGEELWGYSLGRAGRIIVTRLEAPRLIGRDSLLEIELDDGSHLRCTPDHEFVRRDGRLAPACELRPDDSLMPLYRKLVRGYESVYQPLNGHLLPTHRLADEWNLRHGRYADEPGTHRHHRDGNRINNRPDNIERMPAADHIRLHNAQKFGANFDGEEHGRLIRESLATREIMEAHRATPGRNHRIARIEEIPGDHDVYCLTVPEAGNFALEAGVFVRNCGIITNVTPFEPEWEGHVTLEISNTTPLPARVYANEGIAQVLFFESDETCEVSYADKAGKYQGQRGVTPPKL